MGDTTTYNLAFRTGDLDDATVAAVASAFLGKSVTAEEALRYSGRDDQLVSLFVEDANCNEARDFAEDVLTVMEQTGRRFAFQVVEEPAYEWLGTVVRYSPELGLHSADSDADGHAVLTDTQVAAIIAAGPVDGLVDRLNAATGARWADILNASPTA